MIWIDTLAKSMTGDENSNSDMSAVVRVSEAIVRATGATVVLVHHTGKNGESEGRGASALPAGVDFLMHVSGDRNTLTACVNLEWQKDGPAELDIFLRGQQVGGSLAFSRVLKPATAQAKEGIVKAAFAHQFAEALARCADKDGESLWPNVRAHMLGMNDAVGPDARRKIGQQINDWFKRAPERERHATGKHGPNHAIILSVEPCEGDE